MAILEKVPVKFSLLPVANFKKNARGRPKMAVAIFNTKFATGMKKCHGEKKHWVELELEVEIGVEEVVEVDVKVEVEVDEEEEKDKNMVEVEVEVC